MAVVECPACVGSAEHCDRCRDTCEVCADCLNDSDKTDCECREPRDGAFPYAGGDFGADTMDGYRRMK